MNAGSGAGGGRGRLWASCLEGDRDVAGMSLLEGALGEIGDSARFLHYCFYFSNGWYE